MLGQATHGVRRQLGQWDALELADVHLHIRDLDRRRGSRHHRLHLVVILGRPVFHADPQARGLKWLAVLVSHDQLDVRERLGAVLALLMDDHHGSRPADEAVQVKAGGLLGCECPTVPVLQELRQAGLLVQAGGHRRRHHYPGLHRVACLVDHVQLERDLELLLGAVLGLVALEWCDVDAHRAAGVLWARCKGAACLFC